MRGPIIWGSILIVMGVLFLLVNLGVADFGEIIRKYWPLLLIVVGLSMLLKNRQFLRKQQ